MRDCPKHVKLNLLVIDEGSDAEALTKVNRLQLLASLRTIKGNAFMWN